MPQWVLPITLSSIKWNDYKNEINQSINELTTYTKKINQEIVMIGIWCLIEKDIASEETTELKTQLKEYLQSYLNVDIEVFLVQETGTLEKMLLEVDDHIHWLCINEPFALFVQLYQNHSSRLNHAILIEGINTYQDQFISCYVDSNSGELVTKQYQDSSKRKDWLQKFLRFIQDCDYKAAEELLKSVDLSSNEMKEVYYLVNMQKRRLNFSFQKAYDSMELVKKYQSNQSLPLLQTEFILSNLIQQDSKTKSLEQIQELYRQIQLFLGMEDIPSFLTRFYRAREAVLNHIVKYGQADATNVEDDSKIFSSIYKLIDIIERKYDRHELEGNYGAYFYLKSSNVASALRVRNKSFIGHSRSSIDGKRLWSSYYGTSPRTSSEAKRRFLADSKIMLRDLGGNLDDNYQLLNQEIREKIMLLAKKGMIENASTSTAVSR